MNNRIFRYLGPFILVITLFSLVLSGCGKSADQSISFSKLISQASKYNGKAVTLEAYYFGGFEISALSEALGPSSSAAWRIVPTGTLICSIPKPTLLRVIPSIWAN
jgi:hypothetical protein